MTHSIRRTLTSRTVYMDKSKIKRLADYAVRQCCDNSDNCYWSVSYDELYHHFGAEVTDSNENGKLLEEELRQREEINELGLPYFSSQHFRGGLFGLLSCTIGFLHIFLDPSPVWGLTFCLQALPCKPPLKFRQRGFV